MHDFYVIFVAWTLAKFKSPNVVEEIAKSERSFLSFNDLAEAEVKRWITAESQSTRGFID